MKVLFWQTCWFTIFQQTHGFEKQYKAIWLRNLGLRTTVSRPSHRASMSASIFSPQNPENISKSMKRVWKLLKIRRKKNINWNWNNLYLELGARGGSLQIKSLNIWSSAAEPGVDARCVSPPRCYGYNISSEGQPLSQERERTSQVLNHKIEFRMTITQLLARHCQKTN